MSENALNAFQASKGRIPLHVNDKTLFEKVFNEYRHLNYEQLFKPLLLQLKSASLQVRTEFGNSEIILKGFQSILHKHDEFYQSDFNFDLLIDVIDVLAQLRIPSDLLIRYNLGKEIKFALAKGAEKVKPDFPLLSHAKRAYNQMKKNWQKYLQENHDTQKRKASEDSSMNKRPKVVGPWAIKATEAKPEVVPIEKLEEEVDFLMAPRQPLGSMKSFPKGILKSALKQVDNQGDSTMKEKKSVTYNMHQNAIKRIERLARNDKKTLYSERGEASRALKQKVRIEWRSPRGSYYLCRIRIGLLFT